MFVAGQAAAKIEDTEASADSSCISFKGVHSIPLRYPYLEKNLYELDYQSNNHGVSLNVDDFRYNYFKDFILDRCIIPKAVIVGAGMRAHFKKDVLETFDFDPKISAEVNQLLWSAKVESKNGYSSYDPKTGGFDIYEPDMLVVLGYELEDLCKDRVQETYWNASGCGMDSQNLPNEEL